MKILILLLILSGCGESPLFNHKMEKNLSVTGRTFNFEEIGFSKLGLSLMIEWQGQCPSLDACSFKLKTWKSAEATAYGPYTSTAGSLDVFLWMPAMGHGSSPVEITEKAPGEYVVSEVYFIMHGSWDLHIKVKTATGESDEVVLHYSL